MNQPLVFVSSSAFSSPSSALLSSRLLSFLFSFHCRRALICLEVLSSFKCRVVYLKKREGRVCEFLFYFLISHKPLLHTHLSAFRSPSTLLDGCSFSTLMQPFICHTQRQGVRQRSAVSRLLVSCCRSKHNLPFTAPSDKLSSY